MCFTFSFENNAAESIKDYSSKRDNVAINSRLDLNNPLINWFSNPFIPIVKEDRVDDCQ